MKIYSTNNKTEMQNEKIFNIKSPQNTTKHIIKHLSYLRGCL